MGTWRAVLGGAAFGASPGTFFSFLMLMLTLLRMELSPPMLALASSAAESKTMNCFLVFQPFFVLQGAAVSLSIFTIMSCDSSSVRRPVILHGLASHVLRPRIQVNQLQDK